MKRVFLKDIDFKLAEILRDGRGEAIFEVGVPLSGDPSCEDYSVGLRQGSKSLSFNLD